jgi:glycerate dehydrogenase
MSTKPLALFLDRASVYPDDLDFSALYSVAQWQWYDNADLSNIRQDLEQTEIIVSNKVVINRQTIEYCKRLKLICVAATGYNNIDIEAAHQHDVTVSNVRAYATASVVPHVFSLMLALNRKLFSYRKSVAEAEWSRSEFFCYFGEPITELEGKTLGIVGYGELGKAVARVAECFGMKVMLARRNPADTREGRFDLTTLLSSSDVVTLHCPLTESNHHMIAERELAAMKPDAILINAARGGLVDEAALLAALKNNQIGGAALDVLEQEPPPVNHPLTSYQGDNLIVTPHIAWASRQSRQRLVNEIAKNIQAYLRGELRNII